MRVEQHVDLDLPPGAVWEALDDVSLIADCIPGAVLTEQDGDGRLAGWFSIKVGPVATKFRSEVTVMRDAGSMSGKVDGRGTDKMTASQARAQASYQLTPLDAGSATRISVTADIALTGVLGQFASTSVVSQIAARLAEDFAGNLVQRLTAAEAPRARETPSLDAGAALLDAFREFFRRLARRLGLSA